MQILRVSSLFYFFICFVNLLRSKMYYMLGFFIFFLFNYHYISISQVPRDAIERASGLLLFNKLPSSAFQNINGEKNAKYKEMQPSPLLLQNSKS